MTELWMGVILLALTSIPFVLWPIIRKDSRNSEVIARKQTNVDLYREHVAEIEANPDLDETEREQLKTELELSLLEDSQQADEEKIDTPVMPRKSLLLIVLAALVPIVGIWFYLERGASEDLEIAQLMREKYLREVEAFHQNKSPDGSLGLKLMRKLEQRVIETPNNANIWYLLGNTAMEQHLYSRAAEAYQKVLTLDPSATDLLSGYANALFLSGGNRVDRQVGMLLKQALAVNPHDVLALDLSGMGAYTEGQYAEAVAFWRRGQQAVQPNSPDFEIFENKISHAQAQLAQRGDEPVKPASEAEVKVEVTVSLGEQVDVAPDQTVFIYARAWQGPKMPLAISRLKVSDLPRTIVLDETMSMMPDLNLATFPQIEVVARISLSGGAESRSGDWQVSSGPVDPHQLSGPLRLKVDSQVP